MNKFGTFIKQKRLEKELSLRRFASLVGVSPTLISQIENKAISTSEKVIKRMSDVLDVDFDLLLALAGKVADDVMADIILSMGLWSHFIRTHPQVLMKFLETAEKKMKR